MRLPNGYGSIVKMPGNRRKPYCVRLGASYSSDGVTLTETRPVLGYYSSRKEALEALHEFHHDPYDLTRKSAFKDVYALWIREKELSVSRNTLASYKAAFNKCLAVHDMPVVTIKLPHLQAVVDSFPNMSLSTLNNIIIVIHGVMMYACMNELIPKDPSVYLKVKAFTDPTGKHKPFTASEIAALWDMDPSPERDTTLILLYSGWRINELLDMPRESIDLTAQTMTGGKKTRAGKERIVPIHSRILPLMERFVTVPAPSYTDMHEWMRDNMGHMPHDTRHTFISELQSRGADRVCIERLVGHVSKSVTDRVYTHKDIDELRRTVEMVEYKDITMSAGA